MDRAITIFILLLILAVGVVLVAPSYIDWNRYRADIESYAERTLQREVSIEGDIAFKLLPEPVLTIGGLTIANTDEASERIMLGVDRLELHAALRPLFMGDIQLTDVLLVKPQIALEILAGDRTNWRFESGGESEPEIELPAWLRAVARALRLDNLKVKDGTLTYLDPGRGVKQLLEDLNGNFSAATLAGPFEAKGTARMRGVDIGFEWNVGDTSYVRAVPARLAVNFPESQSTINFRGFLAEATLFGPISGKLSFEGPDGAEGLNDLFALIRGAPVALPRGIARQALAQDFRAETDFSVDGRELIADRLIVGLGNVRAKGRLTGRMGREPEFALELGTGSFNLDQLLKESHAETKSVNLAKAPSEIEKELEGFLVPTNLKGTIHIKIDGVIYRAGVIQNFEVKARAGDGKITVDSASGKLPGKATVKSSGLWGPVPGGTRFDGKIALTAETPPAFLRWAGFDLSGIPPDRLGDLTFSGAVRADPAGTDIAEAHLVLDGVAHDGGLSLARGDSGAFRLQLTTQRLDLDTYGGLVGVGDRDTFLRSLFDNDSRFPGSLDVELQATKLEWGGESLAGVDVAFSLSDETMTFGRFDVASWNGARLSLAGTLGGSMDAPEIAIDATADAESLSALLSLLGVDPGSLPIAAGRSALSLKGQLTPDGGTLSLDAGLVNAEGREVRLSGTLERTDKIYTLKVGSGDNSTGSLSVTGRGEAKDDGLDGTLDVAVRADEAAVFLRTYGFAYDPTDDKLGALDLAAEIVFNGPVTELKTFTATVGAAGLEATGRLDRSGEQALVEGDIVLRGLAVDGFLPAAEAETISLGLESEQDVAALESAVFGGQSESSNYGWLARYDGSVALDAENLTIGMARFAELKAEAALAKGTLTTTALEGKIFGGDFSGSLTYSMAELLPELEGEVSLKGADGTAVTAWALGVADDLAPLSASLDLTLDLSALGRDRASLLATLNGTLKLAAGDGVLYGVDLKAFAAGLDEVKSLEEYAEMVGKTLSGGTTPVTSLYGVVTVEDGRLLSPEDAEEPLVAMLTTAAQGDAEGDGAMTFSGTIDLTTRLVNGEGNLTLADLSDAPPLKIRLTGPVDQPRRQFESATLGAFFVDEFARRAENVEKSQTQRQIDAYRSGIEQLGGKSASDAAGENN